MNRLSRHLSGVLFIVLGAILAAAAQDQLRIDVRLVNLVATVTDRSGRYAGDLKAEDFIVEEDGVPQQIAHFTQDHNLPVSLGIILDTSGSMDRKIRTATQAVERFIRTVHEDDDIFLMTFSSTPGLRQDFTSDRTQLLGSLRSIRVSGETALYDGLRDGLHKIREGRHEKRALLLITDGQDTSSSTTLKNLLQSVRQSESLVYSLGISPVTYARRNEHVPFSWPLPSILGGKKAPRSSATDVVNMDVLEELAESSGGRAFLLSESFLAGGSPQMEKVLLEIADELRNQYTLGYYRVAPDDGRFHRIRIRTRRQDIVRARSGYQASGN
jgi:Ca-activated chloride channel family protein